MVETPMPMPRAGTLPDDYQEVLYWNVTEKPSRVLLAQALALLSFCIFGILFFAVAIFLGKLPVSGSFSLDLSEFGAAFVAIVLTLVVHELTHGVMMQLFGAKPIYGILWKGLMLYATSPGYAYQRNTYIIISLAPFVFISVVAILGMGLLQGTAWVPLLAICAAINASGAIGDMWMTMIVLRYAPNAYTMDERDGMRVFLPKPL